MAEQPSGADMPYLAENPSGVGAVFFDRPSKDLLAIHLDNLEGVGKALAEKKEQQKQARAVATKLLEYKNPDTNGIFPKDSEEINKKGQEVTQTMTDLLRIKQDPSNPEWVSAYNSLNNKKQELLTLIGASKAFNKDITSIGGQFAKGELKNADPVYWAQEHEKALKMTAAERAANGISPTNWVREKTPDFKDAMQAYVSKLSKDALPRTTTEVGDGGTAYYTHKIKENITPQQIEEISHGFRTTGDLGKAFEETWETEKNTRPDMIASLKSKYANEVPAIQEQKAQDDYVKGYLEKELYRQQDEKTFKAMTEYGKSKLIWDRASAKNEKDAWKVEASNIADVWNGKPNADKAFLHTALGKKTYPSKQVVDEAGAKIEKYIPIENSIIDAGYDNGKFYVVTRETADENSEINNGNPPPNGGRVYFSSPRALTTFVYGSNANKVDLAFRGTNSMTKDGDYDVQKYSPVSKWTNQPTGDPQTVEQKEPSWYDKNKPAVANKKSAPKEINTKAEFDALPKGATFVRNGKTFTKQ